MNGTEKEAVEEEVECWTEWKEWIENEATATTAVEEEENHH